MLLKCFKNKQINEKVWEKCHAILSSSHILTCSSFKTSMIFIIFLKKELRLFHLLKNNTVMKKMKITQTITVLLSHVSTYVISTAYFERIFDEFAAFFFSFFFFTLYSFCGSSTKSALQTPFYFVSALSKGRSYKSLSSQQFSSFFFLLSLFSSANGSGSSPMSTAQVF